MLLLSIVYYFSLISLSYGNNKRSGHEETHESAAKLAQKWRRIASEYYCKYSPIDSVDVNGGWCLRDRRADEGDWGKPDAIFPLHPAAHHVKADTGIVSAIAKYILSNTTDTNKTITIIDIGAGVGQYGNWFANHAPQISWQGYDGAGNIETFTNNQVKWIDATEPVFDTINGTADWVMSLEVGEHIPSSTTHAFVKTLIRHAKKGIILSWGIPGQGMIICMCTYAYY